MTFHHDIPKLICHHDLPKNNFSLIYLVTVHHDIPKMTCHHDIHEMTFNHNIPKKSLKIPKRKSESVYRRRTDNTIAKRKSTKEQIRIYKTYI